MAKALKVVGVVVGVAALAFTGIGLAAGFSLAATLGAGVGVAGLTVGNLFLVAGALSYGASLLAPRPKAPEVSSAVADRLNLSIDARTPRKILYGANTALATDIRDQEYTDGQNWLHRFIVVASHRIHWVHEVWLDDKLAWTMAGGPQGEFVGYFDVQAVFEGNASNAINISPRMGSTRRYTGCAYIHAKFRLTGLSSKASSPFSGAIPTRVTIRGDGAYLYDPRFDNSVPGGDGAHIVTDQATWAVDWVPGRASNPALQLLNYLIGWRIYNATTGKWELAVGKGIPASRIDMPSFITAANLCDEPVLKADGSYEPRYRSAGIFSEGDDPRLVLDNLKASMNADLDDVDGKIRITVYHNDLATPIGHLSEDDVLGEFRWEQTPSLNDTFNVIRGSYTDPSNTALFQQSEYPEVRIPSPDGIERIETINLPMVQSASQAQRLANQRLQRMLYSGMFSATFSHRAWKFQKGDLIEFSFKPLGWVNKPFRIMDAAVQVDGTVPMVLRVEHEQVYAWDAEEAPAVEAAEPTSYDPTLNPLVQAVAELVDELEDFDGNGFTLFTTEEMPTEGMQVNDLWIDASTSPPTVYIYTGEGDAGLITTGDGSPIYAGGSPIGTGEGGWQISPISEGLALALFAAADAEALADSKIRTYITNEGDPVPTASAIGDFWYDNPTGVLKRWSGTAWEATADRTASNVPTIAGIVTVVINADAAGVTTTTLPRQLKLKAMVGTVDRSTDASFVLGTLPGGIDATINNTSGSANRGMLSITRADSGGNIPVTVTFPGGGVKSDVVPVQRNIAQAPVGDGGTGGGGGGGTGGTSAYVYSFVDPTDSITYNAAAGPVRIKSSSTGTLKAAAYGQYFGAEDYGPVAAVAVNIAYQRVGTSTWTATGEHVGTNAQGMELAGYVSTGDVSITGLLADTDYDVVLWGRRVFSGRATNWADTVFAVTQT